jgi:multidrug efflux pump subunit AcrA (membrane-fusion protein)
MMKKMMILGLLATAGLAEEVYATFNVHADEKYWQRLKIGQPFEYSVSGSAKKLTGKISKIYPTIDDKNRSVTVEVPATALKAGLFGHGMIKVD